MLVGLGWGAGFAVGWRFVVVAYFGAISFNSVGSLL